MQDARTRAAGFRRAFLLVLVLAISALFIAVAWPFLKPLLVAAMLTALFHPFYRWVTRMLGSRRSLGAVVTLLILFIVTAGPLSAFVGLVVKQTAALSNEALPWLQQHFGAASGFNAHDWLTRQFPALADYIPPQERLVANTGLAAKSAGSFVVSVVTRMTTGTATFVLNLIVMVYAMFFFFKDGHAMIENILYYVPLNRPEKTRMLEQFTSITRATLKGTLLIGIIQGTLAGLGFWIAGIDGAAFWGTLMGILSVLPAVGAPLVWLPAGISLLLNGRVVAGLVLMGWCAAVLAAVDYVVRPALIGSDVKMPDLLILVGTLGGLYLFGPIGFILGPIVCGLFLTAWDIYGASLSGISVPGKTAHADAEQRSNKTGAASQTQL